MGPVGAAGAILVVLEAPQLRAKKTWVGSEHGKGDMMGDVGGREEKQGGIPKTSGRGVGPPS